MQYIQSRQSQTEKGETEITLFFTDTVLLALRSLTVSFQSHILECTKVLTFSCAPQHHRPFLPPSSRPRVNMKISTSPFDQFRPLAETLLLQLEKCIPFRAIPSPLPVDSAERKYKCHEWCSSGSRGKRKIGTDLLHNSQCRASTSGRCCRE